MNKILLVPIEPLENRYTGHWYHYLPEQIRRYTDKAVFSYEGDELSTTTTAGAFLNFSSTVNFKSEQMKKIAYDFNDGFIENGDTFLFTDYWNPAAHFVRYMADLAGIEVKMVGICHAGAYDPHDLLGQKFKNKKWSNNLEKAFDELYDHLIFATKFSRDLYLDGVGVNYNPGKHLITGFPMEYYNQVLPYYWTLDIKPEKEDIVVFPHRKSPEKQPELFEELAAMFPEWKFVFAQDVCTNKQQYHNLLYRSKLMFSANLQETLGIGTFEALFAGCDIMVPDRLSYTEMYDGYFKYSNDYTIEKIAELLYFKMLAFESTFTQHLIKQNAEDVMKNFLTGTNFYKAL